MLFTQRKQFVFSWFKPVKLLRWDIPTARTSSCRYASQKICTKLLDKAVHLAYCIRLQVGSLWKALSPWICRVFSCELSSALQGWFKRLFLGIRSITLIERKIRSLGLSWGHANDCDFLGAAKTSRRQLRTRQRTGHIFEGRRLLSKNELHFNFKIIIPFEFICLYNGRHSGQRDVCTARVCGSGARQSLFSCQHDGE